MHAFVNRIINILLVLCLCLPVPDAKALNRTEIRRAWQEIEATTWTSLYRVEPSVEAPYAEGALCGEATGQALRLVNLLRGLSGLEPLLLDDALSRAAQCAALLQAASGTLSHTPDKPQDMAEELFNAASAASAASNLALLNWRAEDVLLDAIVRFAQDDEGENLRHLGHRRWLLYPYMQYTGFGLASSADGYSAATMYVMNAENQTAQYDMVCWPGADAFPAEFMTANTPWSISPNPARYDLEQSAPRIILTERTSGARFEFSAATSDEPENGAYFLVSGGRYGDGPTYVFRPALIDWELLANGYCQNQAFTVTLGGMVGKNGEALAEIVYTVEMVSLTPIDPSDVELSAPSLSLRPGETMSLSAKVIPSWADDLRILYASSDPEIASVSEDGLVTAHAPGTVTITASAVNGRCDALVLSVS